MGNFLGEEHTVEYMRDSYWFSEIFGRFDWSNWTLDGGKTVLERSREYVEKATAGYKDMEPVLDKDLCKELDKIIGDAYKEA